MRGGARLDERGEGARGRVLVAGGRRPALAAVLPDEGPVLVHTRCNACRLTDTSAHASISYQVTGHSDFFNEHDSDRHRCL